MTPTDQHLLTQLNNNRPYFITMLGGHITAINSLQKTCTFAFDVKSDFCHSINIVQGGFVTSMLDAAMSHAVFASDQSVANLSSLEINTSYLEPTMAGKLTVVGSVIKSSYKIAFLEGKVYNSNNTLTATATSVAKIIRPK